MNRQINFEDLPLHRFHIRTVFSGTGGQFSDGFLLGIIGIAVSMATIPLHLDAVWLGLLGAASLAGLFIGSMIAGPFADKFGRRLIFNYDMLLFAIISGLQYFVTSPEQLLTLRLLLGLVLGFDYVASKSLVTEFAPKRYRGRLLSILAAAWAGGYVVAYLAGFVLRDIGPDSWRLMLAISGLPALLILPFRMGIPESPIWLAARGRIDEAHHIIKSKFGPDVLLPKVQTNSLLKKRGSIAELFSSTWRKNTWVGCVFYTCQVIPFFALGTFAPEVLKALNVQDKFTGGLIYNALLMTGAIIGLLLIDKISRRKFLVGSFYLSAIGLSVLAFANLGTTGTVMAFGFFACVLAAAVNLEFVYPPELFPTHLRASGIGVAVASSRFGSAFATFLLPVGVQNFGIHVALGFCVIVLLFGGMFCHLFAPETSNQDLAEIKSS
ncbi:MFS transporter [Enterobacter hormaechei]|uniref:MFS transporter n=1 Tax=Enterobacter hormaechei TaxID=158836 RepID=UPI002616FC4D|nr:MFS transporter [Enterobacter hormaechei]MDN4569132.1 MFS transporter [Enterobacter hormaechei]MDN4997153.1 MFS transporter [Enterobacter hormaechei]MED5632836.1 MFS transporter [Enterobacter hormaechei]